MPNIIQTARGVYDVDTVFGCYSYLIRECGLSGDRCAMVNKLYVMANIAELGAENARPSERLVDELGPIIKDALDKYRCQNTVDENNDALSLVDILSPGPTIAEGQEEIIYLTDHICSEIMDRAALTGKGE